jgi:nicotinate phosphoribosyltransferase
MDEVKPANHPAPKCRVCGGETEPMLKPLLRNGKIVADLPEPTEIRERVLAQLQKLDRADQ